MINETGKPENLLNGRLMWQNMRKLKFAGMVAASGIASGIVSMDDRAERAPLYRGFFVSPNSDQVLPMVHMEPTMLDNCDGIANKSGCYEIIVTDIMRDFWPSIDRKMPKVISRRGCDVFVIRVDSRMSQNADSETRDVIIL